MRTKRDVIGIKKNEAKNVKQAERNIKGISGGSQIIPSMSLENPTSAETRGQTAAGFYHERNLQAAADLASIPKGEREV